MLLRFVHLPVHPLLHKDLVLGDAFVCNGSLDIVNCALVGKEGSVVSDFARVRIMVTAVTPTASASVASSITTSTSIVATATSSNSRQLATRSL